MLTFLPLRFCITVTCLLCCGTTCADEGTLVIVGGGGTPDVVIDKTIELVGGVDSQVVILPQASSREDRGVSSVEMFAGKGVKNVFIVDTDDPGARTKIEAADLIWFPGGQQSLLMESLTNSELDKVIVARHKAGVIIGGTSAGAAVMVLDMIPNSPKQQVLKSGNTPIVRGLGLASDLIVDQHFVKRSRMNRLLSAVVDRPRRVGVGIGERTAILWRNGGFQVLGEGSVVLIDARQATTVAVPEQLQMARDVRLQILRSGDRFELNSHSN